MLLNDTTKDALKFARDEVDAAFARYMRSVAAMASYPVLASIYESSSDKSARVSAKAEMNRLVRANEDACGEYVAAKSKYDSLKGAV